MSPDDLKKMLGLDKPTGGAKTGGAKGVGITAVSATATTAAGPASDNAMLVDEWGLRRGRDLLKSSDHLRSLHGVDEFAAADFHAAAFDPDPQLAESCTDRTRHEFMKQLLDTPEYQALNATTYLNSVASELAATSFAEQFAILKKREDDATPKPGKPGDKGGKGGPGAMDREMEVIRAVGKALADATEEVEELVEAEAALTGGMGAGVRGGSIDPKRVAALFQRVKTDPNLRRICELAGRFRRVAQSKQRTKAVHGMDDLVGVEPGGDIGRLLPVELAKLGVPELELDTLRRLVERQTLCREYQSVEPVAKGPIIVAIDESGSMTGEKVATAKALALAMAWVARQQNRWCALVAYSGDTGERLLALPPGRWNEAAVIEWLVGFIGGGSEIDVPVREMPRMYRDLKAPEGKTDVLFITDAVCRIPAGDQQKFMDWKASVKARLITLLVGGERSYLGSLSAISDEAHNVPQISADLDAVERVLSI